MRTFIFRLKFKFLIGTLLPVFLLAGFSAAKAQDQKELLAERQIKQTVNRINLVTELPIKKGEPINDRYAKSIVELGERATPYLIEKLTDRRDSRYANLFQYKIGDVARSLLEIIYDYPTYPFPDNSKIWQTKYGDYRDYKEFFSSSRNRKLLKKSWRKFIENHSVANQN